MSERRIYFNSSLPRSGSTLLQNILAQNPRFYCSPTSGALELLYAARSRYSECGEFKAQDPEAMRKAFLGFCRHGLAGFYEGLTDQPVCVDKSRGWFHYYEWLDGFWPRPRILVCVRDLRAILSSMEKLYRKNKHVADREDSQDRMNMITVRQRVIHWLNGAPVGLAVMRLANAIETGTFKHLHIVRYEDLTARPEETMKRVYAYLDEPPFPHDFEHVEQKTREDDALYPIYGDHRIREQVRPAPLDYLQVLGRDVCDELKAQNAGYFRTLYPDVR